MIEDILKFANINKSDIIDSREGKYIENDGDSGRSYNGFLILTKNQLIFISKKGLLTAMKKRYEIEVSKITKIFKFPLMRTYAIYANTADKDAGFFKRMFKSKNAQVKIKEGKFFFNKLRELNPKVK
jgi:hypothetical protein